MLHPFLTNFDKATVFTAVGIVTYVTSTMIDNGVVAAIVLITEIAAI